MIVRTFSALLLTIGLIALSGCGSNELAVVPVSGTITFKDGKPVSGGVIEFSPQAGGPGASGKIGSDGSFTLKTGQRNGAIVGLHQIVVIQVVVADGAAGHVGAHHAAMVVHPKYAKYETSGLTREVKADVENVFPITVEAAASAKKGW